MTQCVLMETICNIGLVDKRVRLVNGNFALVLLMECGCDTILLWAWWYHSFDYLK